MAGVGALPKGAVTCSFTTRGFDLKVEGLPGSGGGAATRSYRLLKDNLANDIVPGSSKLSIRSDRLTLKLRKKKGEFSYDHWSELTTKKGAKAAAASVRPCSAIRRR